MWVTIGFYAILLSIPASLAIWLSVMRRHRMRWPLFWFLLSVFSIAVFAWFCHVSFSGPDPVPLHFSKLLPLMRGSIQVAALPTLLLYPLLNLLFPHKNHSPE